MVGLKLNEVKIRTRTSSGYSVSGASVTPGSGENFPPHIQGLGDNSMCLSFLTSGIPIRAFQADFTIFTDASTQGWGAHMGGFPDFGCLDPFRTQAPNQCAGAQGGNIGPPSLGFSITGPSGYDRYKSTIPLL